MTLPQDIIGVDIAKGWIDTFSLSTSAHRRIAAGRANFARFARSARGALVVCEASGGYERPLLDACAAAGVACARVNPRQAREFARASGRLAKTDRVDARVLAEMGRALALAPTPPADPARRRLAQLTARRADLAAMIRAEANRLAQVQEGAVRRDIASLLAILRRRLARIEVEADAQIAAMPELSEQSARMQSMPGIGPRLAATLLAGLPELGHLDRRAIAALAGLAPHASDSGLSRGKRRIWGGRAEVRRALYLAAFIASRHDATLRAFRTRLSDAGKPTKLAIVACARKLLTILNAMIRDQNEYAATQK